MSNPELQRNTLATIAYYDGMDYPLTSFEVWKYLVSLNNRQPTTNNNTFSLANIIKELDEHNVKRFIEEYHGFYFLKGRKKLVAERIKRNKISAAKIKRLKKIVWFLHFIPFVRMIGATGALAMKNADYKSDWDVFIVLKSGRVWTGRTLITGLLHLVGKRRYGKKIKNRICLNHFITDNSLEVATREKFGLFSSHEFFFIRPLFDTGIFEKFQIRNSWIRDYRPNFYLREIGGVGDFGVVRVVREIGGKILGWSFLERWLGNWQSKKIMNNPKTNLPGSFIRATDEHLIFLPDPHGPELERNMNEKMERFLFNTNI